MAANSAAAPAMPRRSHHAPLRQVKTLADAFDHPEFMARIKQAAPKHMSPDRMLATFVLAVRKQPKLLQVDLMSFLGACIGLASVGLEPNTPLGHAYLVAFDEKKYNRDTRSRETVRTNVQVIFGYQGLLDLTYRSGLTRSVHADVVWPGDEFEFHYGSGSQLKHKPLGQPREAEALPVWAYMHAAMKGADAESFEVMPFSEVLAARDRTQAYQAALAARQKAEKEGWGKLPAAWTEAPWVKFLIPMSRKTVFARGAKWLPKSIELAAALQWDELQARRNPDYGAVIEGSASVLDGGLAALEDDGEAGSTLDGLDGLGVGEPEPEPEPELAARPPRAARPGPPARLAPPVAAAAAASTGFQAWLRDAEGWQVGDAHDDPLGFVVALEALLAEHPAQAATILRCNNATIAAIAAEDLGPATARLRDLEVRLAEGPPAAPPGGPASLAVDLPVGRNGVVVAARAAQLLGDAARGLAAADLDAWWQANVAQVALLPDVARLQVIKEVRRRSADLDVPPPAGLEAAMRPQSEADAGDADALAADEAWAARVVADIADAGSVPQLAAYMASRAITERLAAFRRARPELFRTIQAASQAQAAALAPDDDAPGDGPGNGPGAAADR